ncbi:TolC family protein [Desulfocurvibacter africanus]|uniref:Outer membrane efflux protein n=1 Tax=Desulfocurvibacter africanus subsp. africanus str. Walvis Bay TaxID=690850 RepID=F3YUA2_DESAF|nr:TolC family protein [Desulfocurvibacter africanus]EGJ48708.1 outer membrane efflux protein [Desulfocurvibacter africanus subsp. africanus str. Walvis Bay]
MRILIFLLTFAAMLIASPTVPDAMAQQGEPVARPGAPVGRQPLPEPYAESLREDPYAGIMRQDITKPVPTGVEDPVLNRQPSDMTFVLESAVKRGLQANPQIRAARFAVRAGEYGRLAQLGEFGFKVDVTYGVEHFLGSDNRTLQSRPDPSDNLYTFTAALTQPLFTGFRLLNSYQRAKLAKEQAEAQLRQAELQLMLSIQTNYLELLRARMDLKSREDAVARLESQLKVSQAFYDVGLQPRLDVLQAETELANARQLQLNAQNRVSTQVIRLNTLLDLPIDAPVRYEGDLDYVPFDMELDRSLELAYAQRPNLNIARKSVEIAQRDAGIVASRFYPNVNAQLSYSTVGDDPSASGYDDFDTETSDTSVGAFLSWNVFEWGATYNSYLAAKENVSQLESALANERLNVAFEVKANLLAIQEAADRIRAGKTSIVASREGFRMALARYQAQVGTYTEVLDAQSNVTQSEALLAQALSDYQTAMANLYASVGEFNPALRPM